MNRLSNTQLPFRFALFAIALCVGASSNSCLAAQDIEQNIEKKSGAIRVATFNVALNRSREGELLQELESGKSQSASKVAAIIQMIRPDVLLLNEVDFDGGKSVSALQEQFLGKPQYGQAPITYPHRYFAAVNTGVNSNMDLNGDGQIKLPDDAYGFGRFPGQYGMVVLSMHPIKMKSVRTFQKFLWKDMPNALLPTDPKTGKSWYSKEALEVFRLSSKSHWDLPIEVENKTFHFLVSHPTPPVFDSEEDRNGKRNHDEIRLWANYISGNCDWLYDDAGTRGGIPTGASFVIAGDLNADPNDGDSTNNAIDQLLNHERVQSSPIPRSSGGVWFAEKEGKANLKHKGNPAFDTGNFNDNSVGNVRIDYVLSSKGIRIHNQGVFWPKPNETGAALASASDHRLVWIDIELP